MPADCSTLHSLSARAGLLVYLQHPPQKVKGRSHLFNTCQKSEGIQSLAGIWRSCECAGASPFSHPCGCSGQTFVFPDHGPGAHWCQAASDKAMGSHFSRWQKTGHSRFVWLPFSSQWALPLLLPSSLPTSCSQESNQSQDVLNTLC